MHIVDPLYESPAACWRVQGRTYRIAVIPEVYPVNEWLAIAAKRLRTYVTSKVFDNATVTMKWRSIALKKILNFIDGTPYRDEMINLREWHWAIDRVRRISRAIASQDRK